MSLESPATYHNGGYEIVKKQSSSPEPGDGNPFGGKHRRNYQACDRCRQRKVKCDLGPVDAPHPPPCARCQRERAECIFASHRKKDKRGSEERDEDDVGSSKRRRVDDSPVPVHGYHSINNVAMSGRLGSLPTIDPGLQGMPAPTSNPVHRSPRGPGLHATNAQPYHNGALDRQSIKSEDKEVRSSGAESTFTPDQSRTTTDNLLTVLRAAQKIDGFDGDSQKLRDYHRSAAGGPDVPLEQPLSPEQRLEREKILSVWRAARYVRAGWFTAEEALRYVEYFYTHLHPMTPVDVTEFRSPRRHLALLTEEPVLAVAILTISSRYMKLSGRSSDTRAHKIHERLWASLMEQVQRIIWGQEQFGGGFTGAGVSRVRESASGQITWPGSLRSLGTIEALLLLSDWQPRSLHFPPDDDDNHLLNVNYDKLPTNGITNANGNQNASVDALPYASWLEPAWRSDKMCWMLMSLAQGLSSEMGVFDTNETDGPNGVPSLEQQRKNRIRRMVLVYVAQISGRNGITCPVQLSQWEPSHEIGKTAAVDQMQSLWVHIASIMNRANREIFCSRQFTRELTSGLQYRESIDTFARLLRTWKQHFEDVKSSLQDPMLSILEMEYEYARLYINSLGLQNVVDSWMRTAPQTQNSMSSVAKVVSDNKHYIHEVTQASVHILEIVVYTLGSNHYLRDAPIRVFLRCLSAMMFILKRLSLGNHERMVRKCLDLLDRVCLLLAREVVDDVHLCAQTSVLIQSIVKHIKKTLIRVQKPANTSSAPSRDQSRAQTPHHATVGDEGQADGQQYTATLPTVSGAYTHDPLADIPSRPMADFMDQTFIAPPNYNFQTHDFEPFLDDASLDQSVVSDNPADWITMPLDGIINSVDANVDQGFHGIGPMVGSRDMLEVLTNQDYNGMQDFTHMTWTSPTTPFQGFNNG